ncbi:hypothetical protein [Alicyclobacillus mengziensis]|uniref:Uncharacterized protein n=1 Tax=Alicyclobacillus mengziensis TaxID=2931921 RepID=A0A9X7W3M1_9BACL|nr:hypothetical protein [Alicyclobacillus mengziensis]QSO50143.1 hypothetical protein JZ786_24565 [Alicyclobacillus mengziensis]
MGQFLAMVIFFGPIFYIVFLPVMATVNNAKSFYVNSQALTAIEQAKIKGYLTTTDLTTIQDQTAQGLGYPTSLVSVSGTTTPQTRGNTLYLTIQVPSELSFVNLNLPNNITIGASETAASEALQ